jgi:MATE family multidrug resistance protein
MPSIWKDLRITLRLALPIAIGQSTHVVLQITDALMIGHLGGEHLAASAFGGSLFSVFMVFGMGFSGCIATLVSQNRGAGRPHLVFESYRHGLILCLIVGIFSFICLAALIPVLPLFGQDPVVIDLAGPYLFCLALSCVPMAIQNASRQFSEGLGIVIVPMLIAVAGVLVNIAANYLLIYGAFGFPRLELLGAGIATLLVRTLMAISLVVLLWKLSVYRPFVPLKLRWRSWRKSVSLECLRIGLPSGTYGLFEIGAFTSVTIFVGWFGVASLAAHQIVLNMATFTYVITLSLGFAATIRVGYFFGQKDKEGVRRVGTGVIGFAFVFMAATGLLFFFFRKELPGLYISDPEVIRVASSLIVVAALFQIFDGLQSVCLGILRGMGDVQLPMLLCFVAYWVIGIPISMVIAFPFGQEALGFWMGLAIGLAIIACVLVYRFFQLSRDSEKLAGHRPIVKPRSPD